MPDGSRSIHISESTSRGTKVRFGSNRGHLHIVSPRSPDGGRRRAESRQSIAGPQPLVFDEGHTAEIRARLALLVVVGSTCCSGVSHTDFVSTQFMIHKTDRSEPRPHSEPAQQRASGGNQNLRTLLVRGNNPPQSEGQNQARGTRRLRVPATRSINADAYAEPAPAKPAGHQP